jgi:hypothetical protein
MVCTGFWTLFFPPAPECYTLKVLGKWRFELHILVTSLIDLNRYSAPNSHLLVPKMALGRHWMRGCTPEPMSGLNLQDLNQLQYHSSVSNNDTNYLAIFIYSIQLLEFIQFIEAFKQL